MTDDDLKSAELKEEEKKLEDENMRVAQVSQEVPSITDTLSCPKCHKREVSFYQAQTRSADEPMTTFCTCQPCGHQWRVSFEILFLIFLDMSFWGGVRKECVLIVR